MGLSIVFGFIAILGVAAIVLFTVLVIQRYRNHNYEQWFNTRLRELQPVLNQYLHGDISESELVARVGDSEVVAERLILDFLEQMVGEDRERLLHAAQELGLISQALRDMKNPDWTIRDLACQKLGIYGMENTVDPLAELLLDRRMEVRYTAARSLGMIGSQEAVEALIDMLGRPELVDTTRVLEIVQSVEGQVVGHLQKFLDDEDSSQRGKLLAIDLVGDLRESSTVDVLHEILKSSNKEKVVRALKAIGKIGAPVYPEQILDKTDSSEWEIRAQAVKCIGQLEIEDGVPILRQKLGDEAYWVRHNSAEALTAFGERGLYILSHPEELNDKFAQDIAKYQLQKMGRVPVDKVTFKEPVKPIELEPVASEEPVHEIPEAAQVYVEEAPAEAVLPPSWSVRIPPAAEHEAQRLKQQDLDERAKDKPRKDSQPDSRFSTYTSTV